MGDRAEDRLASSSTVGKGSSVWPGSGAAALDEIISGGESESESESLSSGVPACSGAGRLVTCSFTGIGTGDTRGPILPLVLGGPSWRPKPL